MSLYRTPYVDIPVVTAPRFATTVALVALAAALLDAEAKADGCAYAVDWVACREAQKADHRARLADIQREGEEREGERRRAQREAEEREERERREVDAAARMRCQFGGC